MITGVWMDEDDGAMRLAVQLDEDDIIMVDFRSDPAEVTDIPLVPNDWVAMAPTDHDGCIPVEQA